MRFRSRSGVLGFPTVWENRWPARECAFVFLAQQSSVGSPLPFIFLLGLKQSAQLAVPIGFEGIND